MKYIYRLRRRHLLLVLLSVAAALALLLITFGPTAVGGIMTGRHIPDEPSASLWFGVFGAIVSSALCVWFLILAAATNDALREAGDHPQYESL